MRKVLPLVLACLCICIQVSFAQKQANRWYFGLNAGLDFNSGAPVSITGALNTTEGCSSIADSAGQTLFYTDGITVYDRRDSVMPNSGDLMGDVSSTQSALIVPKPGNANLYYVFTVAADGGANGFRYSIVDMTLNNGYGNVSNKNVPVKTNVTEKLTAVSNRDGSGYWVMIHEWGSDAYYAYLLTSTGLSNSPVISNTGVIHSDSIIQDAYGYMKFSPDARKLGVAIGYQGQNELLDFNDSSGVVSNPVLLPAADRNYGLEFSPDNSKLYATRYNYFLDMYFLDQYDLTSGVPATILNSQITISNADVLRALQLGPDKKIYVAKAFYNSISVINAPDSLGLACNFADNVVSLGNNSSSLGLPGYVQSLFRGKPRSAFSGDTSICIGRCINFNDLSSGAPNSWQWHFPGASPDTSSLQNPQNVCYPQAGFYSVQLITGNAGGYDTLYINNYVNVDPGPAVSVTVNGDTLTVNNGVAFQWFLNGDTIPGATSRTYVALTGGQYQVGVTSTNGCNTISNPIAVTGIKDIAGTAIKIYPVPANDYVMVETGYYEQPTISVQNVLGEVMATNNVSFTSGRVHIGIENLAKGFYIVKCVAGDKVMSGGFIKE